MGGKEIKSHGKEIKDDLNDSLEGDTPEYDHTDEILNTEAGAPLRKHPKGRECLKRAEKLEKDIGLFDEKDLTTDHQKMIGQRMRDHMSELLGKKTEDFPDKFYQHLTEMRKAGEGFSTSTSTST